MLERRNGGEPAADEADRCSVHARVQQAVAARGFISAAKRGDLMALQADAVHVDVRDEDGATALAMASRYGHAKCIALLLERHAAVDAADDMGWTPLMEAAYGNHADVVGLLLAAGANPRVESHAFESALSNAREVNSRTCVSLLGAALSAEEQVLEAAKGGDAARLGELLHAGVDLTVVDRSLRFQVHHHERCTVLHWASANGHVACVARLLEHGAAVDAAGSDGWTPLMAAVCNHEPAVVRALLGAGADARRLDASGNAALTFATRWPPSKTKDACAELLRAALDALAHEVAVPQERPEGTAQATPRPRALDAKASVAAGDADAKAEHRPGSARLGSASEGRLRRTVSAAGSGLGVLVRRMTASASRAPLRAAPMERDPFPM